MLCLFSALLFERGIKRAKCSIYNLPCLDLRRHWRCVGKPRQQTVQARETPSSNSLPLQNGDSEFVNLGIGNPASSRAPVPKRKVSAYHSAKMRKMRNALVSAKDSAEEFKQRVKNYEHDRRHRNWRNQQDDRAA